MNSYNLATFLTIHKIVLFPWEIGLKLHTVYSEAQYKMFSFLSLIVNLSPGGNLLNYLSNPFSFHQICKMVTETLWQQVAQMKPKKTLLAIARKVGVSKSVIFRILNLYNGSSSFKFPQKAGQPWTKNTWENMKMQRILMGSQFNAAANCSMVQQWAG